MSLADIRAQALRGEIPREFHNNVLPILGETGECVIVLQAAGVVEYYDDTGRRIWTHVLPDSTVSSASAAYVAAASSETRMDRIPQPRVVTAGRILDGRVWLMVSGADARNSMLVLDAAAGRVQAHIDLNLSGAGPFAIDPVDGRLYIVLPEDGVVVAGSIETARQPLQSRQE